MDARHDGMRWSDLDKGHVDTSDPRPITVEEVAAHLGTKGSEQLATIIPATVNMIEEWKGRPLHEWPERWRLGAVMLIARLDRRRNSPSGVDTVTEMGPVYVSRRDPDVAQLLEIGTWGKPVVG